MVSAMYLAPEACEYDTGELRCGFDHAFRSVVINICILGKRKCIYLKFIFYLYMCVHTIIIWGSLTISV